MFYIIFSHLYDTIKRNITFVDRETTLLSFNIIKQNSNSSDEKFITFISKNKKKMLKIDLSDLNKSLLKHLHVKLLVLKSHNHNN